MKNKVNLIGHLGIDPETKELPSGVKVSTFTLATSQKYRNKDGELVENTEWHTLKCWNGLAKYAEQYLKKGMRIDVEGMLTYENWEDKEGGKHTRAIIRVEDLLNLTPKS